MNLLRTSSGISNTSINDALVDLLGKPIAESTALFIPTAIYPYPRQCWYGVPGDLRESPLSLCRIGLEVLGSAGTRRDPGSQRSLPRARKTLDPGRYRWTRKRGVIVSWHQVEIPTADGTIDAVLVRPETARPLSGVIVLPDGLGPRQVFVDLSQRIAECGYVVLTPNIYYRTARPPVFDFEPDFTSERTMNRFRELTSPLTPEAMARDGSAYIDFLAADPLVRRGPMGVIGFCFTGQFALRMAAARPDRIAAAASFHGGGLVTDTDRSPHVVLPDVTARLYFGHAVNDQSMNVQAIETLGHALQDWGGTYENDTYEGARHGWMIADSKAYHPEQAASGFAKLMALLDSALSRRAQ
jgi:carboxymethylenebutenolidase